MFCKQGISFVSKLFIGSVTVAAKWIYWGKMSNISVWVVVKYTFKVAKIRNTLVGSSKLHSNCALYEKIYLVTFFFSNPGANVSHNATLSSEWHCWRQFIRLHAASCEATKGFILIFSHMGLYSQRPLNALQCVQSVEVPINTKSNASLSQNYNQAANVVAFRCIYHMEIKHHMLRNTKQIQAGSTIKPKIM